MLAGINNNLNRSTLYIVLISAIAIAFRILNSHIFMDINSTIPNFQAVIALSLIGSLYAKGRAAGILLPLYIMLFTDLVLGFHQLWIWTYAPYLVTALIGRFISSYAQPKHIFAGAVSSSLVFFLISNFGVWTLGGYGLSFQGLLACYVAGLPFLGNTILSTLLFSGLFVYMYSPFYRLYYNRPIPA